MILSVVVFTAGSAAADPMPDPPLRRDLASYFVFAMKHSHLKDMKMTQRGCNVGVNCRRPSASSDCGVILHDNPFYADDSQIAGCTTKFSKPGGSIWQLFRDNVETPLDNVTIRHPGIRPDGSNPCGAPIIPDVDMDGEPSCQTVGQQCQPDYGDLEEACGFPVPFPACAPGTSLKVPLQADCPGDADPGNATCDLPPGVYGDVSIPNAATLNLAAGGEYVFCSLSAGKNVRILGAGATLFIPDGGQVLINNGSLVGLECGDVAVRAQGGGPVRFGRNSTINMRLCAPESDVQLGHGNTLRGQFFGSTVDSDVANEGGCCAGRCACFDTLEPTEAAVGDTITLDSHCDLSVVTDVRVCGVSAPILTKTSSRITAQVPAGTAGASCDVEVVSPAGTFIHVQQLTVD